MTTVLAQAPVDTPKMSSIYRVLKNLTQLQRVEVEQEDGYKRITISHSQQYVPDFVLEWCPLKKHYRVYIHVASVGCGKTRAGYCILTVGTSLSAIGFATLYQFLHKHRANNKESAE